MHSETRSLRKLSLSLPEDLSRKLDVMVNERGLASRSGFIAELIGNALAENEALTRPDEMLTATVTLVYQADRGHIRQQIAQTQCDFGKVVISSQHVFLEDDQSIEALLLQGPAWRLRELCDAFRRIRGVRQLRLVTTTALLLPLHDQ